MSDTIFLDVEIRDVLGKKVKHLRQQGLLPATIYGKGFEPLSIQIDDRTFNKVYRQVGRIKKITLNIPDQPQRSVLVQEVQRHPVTRAILHAELRVIEA